MTRGRKMSKIIGAALIASSVIGIASIYRSTRYIHRQILTIESNECMVTIKKNAVPFIYTTILYVNGSKYVSIDAYPLFFWNKKKFIDESILDIVEYAKNENGL